MLQKCYKNRRLREEKEMKIQTENADAIELVKDIKAEMAVVRDLLGQLEYLVYTLDERCEISFFERGENDKTGSKK